MTTMALRPKSIATVEVEHDRVVLRDLAITHAETVTLLRAHAERHGSDALEDAVLRALPIGVLATLAGNQAADSGALQRVLDTFGSAMDETTRKALTGLEDVLTRLDSGERDLEVATTAALEQLPAQVAAALAGQGGSVKAAVLEAARSAQAAALADIRASLAEHSRTVQAALSLGTEDSPVAVLRRDVLTQLSDTRRELGESLTQMRGLLQAAEARTAGSSKSTRAIGQAFETDVLEIMHDIVTASGDLFEITASTPGAGGTRRSGDAVATLTSLPGQSTKPLRLALECKKRTRPLTVPQLRAESEQCRQVRDAAACLIIVDSNDAVPGPGRFCRVDPVTLVVSSDDEELLRTIWLVLRELTIAHGVRANHGGELDVAEVERHLNAALAGLNDLSDVARHATAIEKSLASLRQAGSSGYKKVQDGLQQGLANLRA